MSWESDIRKEVIPNAQIKLLDLCVEQDVDQILMPPTQRKSNTVEFRADWALKDVIKQRIEFNKDVLPLVLRKRKIYEKSLMQFKNKIETSDYSVFAESDFVPITLRKHLLYLKSRAG